MNNLDEIAHKIAMYAIEQRDNVNAYTAVKTKVLELLEQDERPWPEFRRWPCG